MGKISSVSIIGRGDFGTLLQSFVPDTVECNVYGSTNTKENIETIARSDVIILSIPLQAYDAVLALLQPVIRDETLLIDVCSVKVKPAALIHAALPQHKNVLLTHPLFGPQSIKDGNKHTLVITETFGELAEIVENFCKNKLNLEVMHMTNEIHDKRMAEVHALTFFIARGLRQLNLHNEPFMTPSFKSLLRLAELDKSQTEALFQTIQNGNPFAADERKNFLGLLEDIDKELSS